MKSILITFLAALTFQALAFDINTPKACTEPQQIITITRILHEKSYYDNQVDLWKQELVKDEENPNAWMNFYLASRIVNMLTADMNPHDLDDIYQSLSTKIKGSYEYEYLSYLNGKADPSLLHHLEKAYQMDPDRTETYSHMINHHIKAGSTKEFALFCKKWLESGDISSGILSWNYNALIGLEPNAILLTYGDNDTYPSWMLQQVDKVRTDVTVLNIHLLKDKAYCNRNFNDLGIPHFQETYNEETVWQNDLVPLVDHMMKYAERPLYFNITLPKKVRDSYEEVLYNVGLAIKFSKDNFDNIAVLKNNYEHKFLTDYLRMGFAKDESATVLNSMNVSYLPAFVTLYKDYISKDETKKAEEIKKLLLNIGRANNKEEQILTLISTPKKWNKGVKTYIDIKSLDKSLKKIKSTNLWATESEITNASYEQFLMDLLKNKEFELLEICKTTKIDWRSLLPEEYKHLDDWDIITWAGSPDDPLVPVTNISYEAALAYCEWLSLAYNGYTKKKKYQNVRFRLPTEKEWEMAARANHKDAAYPWGGFYYKNAKGCFLSNFYSSDEKPCEDCNWTNYDNDGGFFLVKADSYFPNDYGLYGMSGNAAEMIQGGLIAKGGSWEDLPADCTIESRKPINGKSPALGFRVFMEIIN